MKNSDLNSYPRPVALSIPIHGSPVVDTYEKFPIVIPGSTMRKENLAGIGSDQIRKRTSSRVARDHRGGTDGKHRQDARTSSKGRRRCRINGSKYIGPIPELRPTRPRFRAGLRGRQRRTASSTMGTPNLQHPPAGWLPEMTAKWAGKVFKKSYWTMRKGTLEKRFPASNGWTVRGCSTGLINAVFRRRGSDPRKRGFPAASTRKVRGMSSTNFPSMDFFLRGHHFPWVWLRDLPKIAYTPDPRLARIDKILACAR